MKIKLLIKSLIFILLFSFTGSAQKKKTERETDGLKGAVKYVSTKRTDVTVKSKKIVESQIKFESEITYNKNGERLNYKNYHYVNGFLFEDITYGFIDGERISNYKDVDNPNKLTAITSGELKPKKESDPRYDYKFKYKYDENGNMSEESWYQNDGDLWLKYVYNYKGKQREDLVYSADGSLNQKYLYIFDDKENEIEMFFYETETDEINRKESYKYLKFDANGNWTKRIASENEENDLKRLKPYKVQYRNIIYY